MQDDGRRISQELRRGADTRFDSEGHLRGHVNCICGYDLFGLRNGQQCPECGAPVGLSLHGGFLQYGQPQWLRRVGHAVRVNALLLLALPVILLAEWWPGVGLCVPVAVLLGWSVTALWATWPEPAVAVQRRQPARERAMISAVALAALATLSLGADAWRAPVPLVPSVCVLGVGFLTALRFYGRWLAGLALRVPSPDLWESLRLRPVYLIVACVILTVLFGSGTTGLLLSGLLVVIPLGLVCMWLMGYSCLQAGDLLLSEARSAAENQVIYAALLDKEQRWRQPVRP